MGCTLIVTADFYDNDTPHDEVFYSFYVSYSCNFIIIIAYKTVILFNFRGLL